MKKFATLMLALAMLISCAAIGMAEDITLDVIICQYGPKTNDWFTGTGMNGTSFVKKFEEANPGIKLNLEVVSWNDVYTVVSHPHQQQQCAGHPELGLLRGLRERGSAHAG